MTLPGVGEVTAKAIIDARSERPFASLADVEECCAAGSFEAALQALAGVQ